MLTIPGTDTGELCLLKDSTYFRITDHQGEKGQIFSWFRIDALCDLKDYQLLTAVPGEITVQRDPDDGFLISVIRNNMSLNDTFPLNITQL